MSTKQPYYNSSVLSQSWYSTGLCRIPLTPDVLFTCRLKSWAVREAFLELERREQEGLALVDPNVVDPVKIELPDDAALEDFEIII